MFPLKPQKELYFFFGHLVYGELLDQIRNRLNFSLITVDAKGVYYQLLIVGFENIY